MNSYQYTNTVQGATSIAATSVTPDNIYTIDRNGIGYIRTTFTDQDITANVFSFEWKGDNPGPVAVPGRYLIVVSVLTGFAGIVVTIEVGPVVLEGVTYSFLIFPQSALYVSQSGDTDTDVRDGLLTAINAFAWDDTVTAVAVSTNRIEITILNLDAEAFTNISNSLYKSGYYCEFSLNGGPVNQYLIESNSAGFSYPALGSLDSSYLYSDLTAAPYGIETLLEEPPFSTALFSDTSIGTTDITASPQVGTVPAGKCVYYNSTIYFAEPMNSGEVIKMIVL